MRAYARWILLVAVVLTTRCTSTRELDENRLDGLERLAAEVKSEALMATVHEVVAAHQSDTPEDCGFLEEEDPDSAWCHLTRVKARELLRGRLESLGYTVTEQVAIDGSFTATNVVAEKRGTRYPDEIVLVGAHFDAFFAGADDNTSGVAALLEVARLFAPHSFERTVRFVGFDLEEFGLVGSIKYVDERAKSDNVVAAVIVDSIAFRNTAPGSQTGIVGFSVPSTADFIAVGADADSASLADELWQLNRRFDFTSVALAEAPGRTESVLTGDLMRSDHAPFWLAGKPALFFSDTADLRNAHYHQPTDTPDTLDPEFLAEVTRLVAVSLAYWAGGLQP